MPKLTSPWITGGAHCDVHWLCEGNRWDPKPFFENSQYQGTRVRLERTVKSFAETGNLKPDKGHWRKGAFPKNKLYEFKDIPSGTRLLAFRYNPSPDICWFIVALGVVKDRGDITSEEEERAIQRRQRFLDNRQSQTATTNTTIKKAKARR